jgi:hypothetical protein
MGLVFGESQRCWRCKGSGRTERHSACPVCGGSGVTGQPKPEEGREEGRARRDAVLERVAAAESKWSDRAARWISERVQGVEFTADDLTADIGAPAKTAATGSAFAAASRRGLIERVGLQQSANPTSHASVIMVWRRR